MNRDELLREVALNIEAPGGTSLFTSALEDHYRTSIAAARRPTMLIAGVIGMAILWIFMLQQSIFVVPSLRPEQFWQWLLPMLGIAALVGAYLVVHARVGSHRRRDFLTMAIMTIMSPLVCLLLYFQDPELRSYGMFCYVMIPVACNNLVWLHFRQALLVTLVSLVVWAGFLLVVPEGMQIKFVSTLMLVSVSAMTLWSNWRTDRGERAAFLWLTRERLLSELSRRQNAELLEMSAVDPLTGIANRRAFEDRFRALDELYGAGPIAVMMIDIDHFKLFNDHYGHLDGDHCLQNVAMTLAEQLRGPEDIVARLGGEEFVIVMPHLTRAEAEPVLERVRRAVEALAIPHEGTRGNPSTVLTISIGCAIVEPSGGDRRRSLLALADRALYQAKREGRNCWRLA
jgi:diguanylate cyclase (GGDEF)-like protein